MDRKSAIAAAGTVALTLTATGVAIAANMGLLNQKPSSDLGQLSASVPPPATAEISTGPQLDPEVVTIYENVRVPAGSAGAGPVPLTGGLPEEGAIPSFGATNPVTDDNGDDGFKGENEAREDEDQRTEDHRTEDNAEDHRTEDEDEDHRTEDHAEDEDDD